MVFGPRWRITRASNPLQRKSEGLQYQALCVFPMPSGWGDELNGLILVRANGQQAEYRAGREGWGVGLGLEFLWDGLLGTSKKSFSPTIALHLSFFYSTLSGHICGPTCWSVFFCQRLG